MSRSIVYERDAFGPGSESTAADASKYGGKLAKYVPAEVLAFFVPVVAIIDSNPLLWVALVLATVFTPVYVWIIAGKEAEPQRWYTYVIAILAFVVWAIGTTEVGAALFRLETSEAGVVLMVGVFVVPALDQVASRLFSPES
jgi:hypothetical protein